MSNKQLITICGPTSSGKTSLAVKLCNLFNGEIVSADSRQVYKYMDVGTGKIPIRSTESRIIANRNRLTDNESTNKQNSAWRIQGVPIHGYDLVEPGERFSAGDFKDYAQIKFQEIWNREKIPFLVGGTGFYIAAALGEVELSGVPANPELRKELNKLETKKLVEMLKELDPEKLKNTDQNNPQRLIRAIEISIYKGKRPEVSAGPRCRPNRPHSTAESLSRTSGAVGPNQVSRNVAKINRLKIGLKAPRKILYQRADKWAETIIEQGLIEEAETLIEMGYKKTKPMQGIIYSTVIEYLNGEKTKEEMLQRIKWDLHKYIRRQLTWFRRDEKIKWLDISKDDFDTNAETLVESYLKK